VGHNFVLALQAELGILGLTLFCAVLLAAFVASRRAPAGLSALWLTISLAWLAGALLHNWEFRKVTWVLLGLMVVSGSLRQDDGETADTPSGVSSASPSRVPGLRQLRDATSPGPTLNQPMAATRGRG
jgi:hypothetical protein